MCILLYVSKVWSKSRELVWAFLLISLEFVLHLKYLLRALIWSHPLLDVLLLSFDIVHVVLPGHYRFHGVLLTKQLCQLLGLLRDHRILVPFQMIRFLVSWSSFCEVLRKFRQLDFSRFFSKILVWVVANQLFVWWVIHKFDLWALYEGHFLFFNHSRRCLWRFIPFLYFQKLL